MLSVLIKTLPHFCGLSLPAYQTELSAGADILAACDDDGIVLQAGERALIPTGFSVAIPAGYEMQIRPRSGLAFKHGVTVCNSPGTIDADYRGEVQVLLINLGQKAFKIERGMRIAQLVIAPVVQAVFNEVQVLPATERGSGGFGHTGV
ncbi:MAG: dUTP diphosphatase [Clostridia bacterium]|nr:dUTP diphosphatase [Clostridia bacterium]MDD4798906.1 dUTP diphosphatase [Clostridia bacterium]